MHEEFDPTDYSVVVKLRGNPSTAWKWEIYRDGRWGPLESSPVFFESMAMVDLGFPGHCIGLRELGVLFQPLKDCSAGHGLVTADLPPALYSV